MDVTEWIKCHHLQYFFDTLKKYGFSIEIEKSKKKLFS